MLNDCVLKVFWFNVKAKWVAEFLPKPEPPRFFRPLCARLARQQERLREQKRAEDQLAAERIEHARRRMQMSVSEVRTEQKQMLREARQRRKEREGSGSSRRERDNQNQQQSSSQNSNNRDRSNTHLLASTGENSCF